MKDLFVRCPFHSDGNERTPSLSILLQDRGNLKAGFGHCFSCGWSGNYKQVEKALGHSLDISPAIRAQLENGSRSSVNTTFRLRTAVDPDKAVKKQDLPFKFSQYLKDRGIGEVIQRVNKVYQNGVLNMPFFNSRAEFMGSIERGVGEEKFYRVNGSITSPIGIEEISRNDFVYCVEGQIDKMSLEESGFKAVALGSVSNFKLLRQLQNMNICFAYDNDAAGMKGVEYSFQYLRQIKRFPNLYILTLPSGIKDINELLVKEGRDFTSDWVKCNTRRF